MFARLCELMGNAAMAQDPRYVENVNRVENQTELDGLIGAWTGSLSQSDVLDKLEAAGVAAGPIYSVEDMFKDPQYHARGLFETVTIDGEPLKIPAIIPQLADTPGRTDWPGAALGEHNAEVFGELLGMTSERLAEMKTAGIV
jgi:crotonobetainyl-CoA:carnitine CoA-transferase CaiB-like acyl-CoA transferase